MMETNPLLIENKTWSVNELIQQITRIVKPKFQRKSKWLIHPIKKKRPSYSEYIEFLFKTNNSIDPISFGHIIQNNNEQYINIDGNNRMNAIIKFVKMPIFVFKETLKCHINELKKYIDLDIIYNISYEEISGFRRLKDIESVYNIRNQYNEKEIHYIEDTLTYIQEKLLIRKQKFTDCVKLNINIFKNGSFEDYNDIFKSINTHSNELSENELLASILYSVKLDIDKSNSVVYDIINSVNEYYNYRDNEELLSYNTDIDINNINPFDFMVGLQNLLNKKTNNTIGIYDSNGLGLIFKLFKIYTNNNKINKQSFINFNTNDFINVMIHMSKIVNDIFEYIYSTNVDDRLFGNSSNIRSYFKKNNLYVLCSSIISLINNDYSDNDITRSLIKPVIYHILVKYLPKYDSEDITLLREKDTLKYEAGGSYIDNLCKKIYCKEPEYIYKDMNNLLFKKLLSYIRETFNKPCMPKNNKGSKRRKLTIIHKIIFNVIFKSKVPTDMLNNTYSIEHLIPFSSKFTVELDIDRIGNLFPIPLDYNKKRGNKPIDKYSIICNEYNESLIKKICNTDNYNKIVVYDKNVPHIKDIDGYNTLCERNEKYYLDTLFNYIFKC